MHVHLKLQKVALELSTNLWNILTTRQANPDAAQLFHTNCSLDDFSDFKPGTKKMASYYFLKMIWT
jgi:hypothetical protein